MPMSPKTIVEMWVEAFNSGNAESLAEFYSEDAVNHQVAESPVQGKDRIREMFAREFSQAEMTCLVENLFEDGDSAPGRGSRWRRWCGCDDDGDDLLRGLFGCLRAGKIAGQAGYDDC